MTIAPARPAFLSVIPDSIPRDLTDDVAWYPAIVEPKAGKPGKWDKIPGDPRTGRRALWSDPATRLTFDRAYMAYQSSDAYAGVGYMMHASGITGVDVDDAFAPDGSLRPHARRIKDALPGAYWERSISSGGLRGFCRAVLPPGRRKVTIDGSSVEIYSDVRFLTLTGHALEPVEVLPELQAEVEALHAEHFGGEALADAGVVTTGAGAAETVPVEYMPILEAMLGGKYAAQMAKVWAGDFSDFGGDESNGEWALAKETVYHAMALGLEGDELARAVEAIMRAGPYRPKWDTIRPVTRDGQTIRTTWLGRTIGRAIKARERRGPLLVLDEPEAPASDAPADETPAQIIARLERELAQRNRELARERAVAAVRASALRYERERVDELDRRAKDTRDILRNPALSPTDKVVFMTIAWRVESGVSRGQQEIKIVYPEIAEAAGVSTSTVGRTVRRCATDDDKPAENPDAPVVKRTVTEWRTVEGAGAQPTSTVYLRPKAAGSVLAAAATYAPPEARKHGGRRLPRCPEHPTADLVIRSTTHCAECGEQLGAPTETLRCQLDSVESTPVGVGSTVTKGCQLDSVGPDADADARARAAVGIVVGADRLRKQDAAVGPTLLLDDDGPTLILDDDELALRRAREAVAIPPRAPDKRKQPGIPESEPNGHGESIGRIAITRSGANGHAPPIPCHTVPAPAPTRWRCPECPASERKPLPDGSWRCPRGHVSREAS